MGRNFTRLPDAWVERIFERLECTFKDRWTRLYGDPRKKDLYKTMWSTGLSGLTVPEIQKALSMCESFPHGHIPNHIEFYHYAKGLRRPPIVKPVESTRGNPTVARSHLDSIKASLKEKHDKEKADKRSRLNQHVLRGS